MGSQIHNIHQIPSSFIIILKDPKKNAHFSVNKSPGPSLHQEAEGRGSLFAISSKSSFMLSAVFADVSIKNIPFFSA